MERRTFLKSSGAASVGLLLAGCTGSDGNGNGSGGDTTTVEGTMTSAPDANGSEGADTAQPTQQGQQGQQNPGEFLELDGDVAQDSHEKLKFLGHSLFVASSPVEASSRGGGAGSENDGSGGTTNATATNSTATTSNQTATNATSTTAGGTQNGSDVGQGGEGNGWWTTGQVAGVRGELKNVGNETFTYVEVNVTLYDESDDVLGEWLDNTEEESIGQLKPGQKWDFDVVFQNADIGKAASYSISADGKLS